MHGYTRRRLLAQVVPGLVLGGLLSVCERTVSRIPTVSVSPAIPTIVSPVVALPSATATPEPRRFRSSDACVGLIESGASNSQEPYRTIAYFDVTFGPVPFAKNVQAADMILLATVREILPSRWATDDGRRPSDPQMRQPSPIVTPVRLSIERAAGRETALRECYTLIYAGRVGDECQANRGTPPWGIAETFVGDRALYFLQGMSEATSPFIDLVPLCLPFTWYPVRSDGTIAVHDRYDVPLNAPPRTLTVDEALREIAALLGGSGATPTR